MQIPRFTASKPSKFAFASDEKSIRQPTTSFVRCYLKKGVLYSKDSGDGDTYSMIPPTEDVVSDYSVDITTDKGQKVHIGNYSTVEELDKAISDAVKTGQITQEEADAARQ